MTQDNTTKIKNYKRIHGLTVRQLTDTGQHTAVYQRELLMEHRICKLDNNAEVSVRFIQTTKRWAVICSDCLIYTVDMPDLIMEEALSKPPELVK